MPALKGKGMGKGVRKGGKGEGKGGVRDLPAVVKASESLAGIFAALGDPTRLRLVAALCAGGAFSIAQLTATTDISRQGVTKHLQVLADAGVVKDFRLGRERVWQLEPAQIEEARRTLDVIGSQWEATLGKLKDFIELS